MSQSRRSSWSDVLVAGLLAVLTGQAILDARRGARARAPAPVGDEVGAAPQVASEVGRRVAPVPAGAHVPDKTVWPFVLSGGIALLLFGVVTSLSFSVVGVALMVGALGGWIGDLLRAQHE